ncbi:DUF2974 domain-containing protein [Streptococcus merionis]|uniref:Esterase/lipase n=1 Tax=Streptococcus merionis TaxID=400065 RepID=A0A239SLY6_9STRE|nr:DUF2974 domain-containing protein [Streptococcus merionis]SNU86416.1 Esterase/lipase [Streptococcus merionis]
MANLIQYVADVAHLNFYDLAPSALDALVLTELSYLLFDDLAPSGFEPAGQLRLADLAEGYFKKFGDKPTSVISHHNRLTLLKSAAATKRYKNIKVLGYVNDYDLDLQKQFAAVTYKWQPGHFHIAFRGTDDSIIGWKEDFHMTYMRVIPAQLAAQSYLTKAMTQLSGIFSISGHSKGGNLALYAASQVSQALQDRIQSVTAFDAPGLHQDLLESSGYRHIEPKIQSFIPQDSIIGMMMTPPRHARIVKSRAAGLLQHDTFNWIIEDKQFALAESLTTNSIQTDQAIKSWTEQLTEDELRDFFDILFGLFLDAGIERIGMADTSSLQQLQTLIAQKKGLPIEQTELLDRLSKQLVDNLIQVRREQLFKTDISGLRNIPEQISSLTKDLSKITASKEKATSQNDH